MVATMSCFVGLKAEMVRRDAEIKGEILIKKFVSKKDMEYSP